MNREALENLVLESTGRADKLTLIRSALDLAVEEVSTQHSWTDLQTGDEVSTATDVGTVTLADDMVRPLEFRLIEDTLSRPLSIRPKVWVTRRFPYPESTNSGKPTIGYIEGLTLYLVPIPDAVYTIRYTYHRLHPALSSPTSELLIRAASRAVVAYATYWVFQALEQHDNAGRWLRSYNTALMSAKRVDQTRPAVEQIATPRGEDPTVYTEYWLDPFCERMP